MRIELGREQVIVQGIRPEEGLWGPYQFPRPYRVGDKLYVAVHVDVDEITTYGADNRWFESCDLGESWHEVPSSIAAKCGLLLQNGDRVIYPPQSAIPLDSYKIPNQAYRTPGTDMDAPAAEGELPFPDGMTFWMWGTQINAYRDDRLPPSLRGSTWKMLRLKSGKDEAVSEEAKVDWKALTKVVFIKPNETPVMKAVFPRGDPKIGPDGAIWVTAFSGEGHINPENGQYSPYYSAELFRSEDMGKSFSHHAHMEYPADGSEYPYLSGGFSDSDIAFMDDGSILWAFRSNWYGNTGLEWAPMYMSRSIDMGKTWSKPKKFSDIGTLPRFLKLKCDVTLITYARPGMYIRATEDPAGEKWDEPIELMTPGDRSSLHNIKVDTPTFHQWVGACNNPELLPIDDTTAMIFYGDAYYPGDDGIKYKTILCRKIRITKE